MLEWIIGTDRDQRQSFRWFTLNTHNGAVITNRTKG